MNAESLALVLRLLGIGWYVAVCIGGGAYGGFLLDRHFGLSPLLTLLGLGHAKRSGSRKNRIYRQYQLCLRPA